MIITDEVPVSVHRDGSGLLHAEGGPAIEWQDGHQVWVWHGVAVPKSLIDPGWTREEILREENVEIRRCAIEAHGWGAFLEGFGPPIAECPDPGNPGKTLRLYDVPMGDLFSAPAKILVCENGTPETDGRIRTFGLPVPGHHTDPVAAAAELYGWPVADYRKLSRRT